MPTNTPLASGTPWRTGAQIVDALTDTMPIDDDGVREVTRSWLAVMWNCHTRAAYARALTQWWRWAVEVGVDPLTATRDNIEDWVADMGFAPRSRIRKLGALSSWYKRMGEEGLSAVNPARPLAG